LILFYRTVRRPLRRYQPLGYYVPAAHKWWRITAKTLILAPLGGVSAIMPLADTGGAENSSALALTLVRVPILVI